MLEQIFSTRPKPSLRVLAAFIFASTAATSGFAAPDDDRFPIDLEQVEARSAAHFRALDANSNGEVDLTEFEAAPIPNNGYKRLHQDKRRTQGAHHKRAKARHHSTNSRATRESVQRELFDLLDQNNSGRLNADEFANGDSTVRKRARQRATFKHLDADQNGVLVPSEMPTRGKRLRRADKNSDGKVTRRELRTLRATHPRNAKNAG